MLAIILFLSFATIFDIFPSSLWEIDVVKSMKYNCVSILSFWTFYTLKCFCLYNEIWHKQITFVLNYDKCNFSTENEDDSTLISFLNFTYYFLVDDRVNYILSIFLFIKIWCFSSPNGKWIDHSLHNHTLWLVNYYFKNQNYSFYTLARLMIIFSVEDTLKTKFNPTKPDLYQGLSEIKIVSKFAILFLWHYITTMAVLGFFIYAWELISNNWDYVLGISLDIIYLVFWYIFLRIYSWKSFRFAKLVISNSLKRGKNIYEVIVFAILVLWGIFKIISLALFYNGISLLLEYYYYIPHFFELYQKILHLMAFGFFLSYPKMAKEELYWKWQCILDFLSLFFSLYILEYIGHLLNK